AAKAGARIPDPSGGAPAAASDGERNPRTSGTARGGDATPEAAPKGSGSGARPAGRDRAGFEPSGVKASERERELTHSS
ncbi:hypothetical protein KUG12_11725, partial [Streptomyces sp. BV333]|nr:hypothetical protein [Streptomyces sp. BV333]